jgi:hypothetical protein
MAREGFRYWLEFGAFTLGFVLLSIASAVMLGFYAFGAEFDSGETGPVGWFVRVCVFAIYFPSSTLVLFEGVRDALFAADDEGFLLFVALAPFANALLWWRVLGLVHRRRELRARAAGPTP